MKSDKKLYRPNPPIYTEYGDELDFDIWDDSKLNQHDTRPWPRFR